MSDSFPPGWVTTSLGALCDEKVTQGPPTDEPVPYIDISSIDRSTKRVGEARLVTRSDAPTRARQWVRTDDVLVSMTRPNLNAVAQVTPEHDGAVASTGFDVLRPRGVVSEWILYRVRTNEFVADVCGDLQGVVYPAIRPHDIRRHNLPLPPSGEQRRIVEAIESYFTRLDDAVATLERVQRNLKRYRASVLKAAVEGRLVPTEAALAGAEGRDYEPASVLLERILTERRRRWEEAELAKMNAKGKPPKDDKWKSNYKAPVEPDTEDLPELPEGWSWASVEHLASNRPRSIQSGPFGSNLLHSEFQASGRLVVGIDNVQDGYFSMGSENRISESKFRALDKYRARAGDVLVTVMATIGRCCVIPDDLEPAIITKHVYRVSPQPELVSPRYLHLALWGGPIVRDQMFAKSQGQTRPGLNGTIIKQLCIPLPPRSEQDRIVEEADRLLSIGAESGSVLAATTQRCARLRQSTLKWAFEGRLVDQDPTDEPASRLLERMQAGRESKPAGPARTRRRARATKGRT